jgi:hypothetical protein
MSHLETSGCQASGYRYIAKRLVENSMLGSEFSEDFFQMLAGRVSRIGKPDVEEFNEIVLIFHKSTMFHYNPTLIIESAFPKKYQPEKEVSLDSQPHIASPIDEINDRYNLLLKEPKNTLWYETILNEPPPTLWKPIDPSSGAYDPDTLELIENYLRKCFQHICTAEPNSEPTIGYARIRLNGQDSYLIACSGDRDLPSFETFDMTRPNNCTLINVFHVKDKRGKKIITHGDIRSEFQEQHEFLKTSKLTKKIEDPQIEKNRACVECHIVYHVAKNEPDRTALKGIKTYQLRGGTMSSNAPCLACQRYPFTYKQYILDNGKYWNCGLPKIALNSTLQAAKDQEILTVREMQLSSSLSLLQQTVPPDPTADILSFSSESSSAAHAKHPSKPVFNPDETQASSDHPSSTLKPSGHSDNEG